MPRFRGYYLCPNYALFRCLCESSGLISSISRISEYLRLIKPDCNATGAFPARFYLSFTNPRLGIKWIQIFYHCVGRCWWVVIVFLYFLDVLVWVALLLAKVHGTEVKKKKYILPSTLTAPLVKLFFIKILRQKTFTNNVFTTRPQQPLYATLNEHQFIHTKTKTLFS